MRTSSKSADAGWRLGPDAAPIVVGGPDAAPVVARLDLFLDGWNLRPAVEGDTSDIAVTTGPDGYALSGVFGYESGFDDPLDAANALAGALVMIAVARDPALICLHAGAARVGAGVIALVGDSGAGKSSVALMLAASGHFLFGDDRVGLRTEGRPRALALGLAPKARLPLPPESDDAYAQFIADRTAFAGPAAAYLRMKPGEQAPFGADAPLAAVAVLARGAANEGMAPLGTSQAVRALLPHCYAAGRPAATLVRALESLARRVPVVRLDFAESRRAARHLAETFVAAPPAETAAHG